MSPTSPASQALGGIGYEARQAGSEVKDSNAAAASILQNDLHALREDFGRLAQQVSDLVSREGSAALRRARSSVDSVVADAQDRGREAVGAMREVSDNFVDAVDASIKTRPYTTLALVAGLAFLFGATWRR